MVQRWISDPPPDRLFEITENSLIGASPKNPDKPKGEVLNEKASSASPSTPNLTKPQLYRDALKRSFGTDGKGTGTALVIPDYAVRMAILDFEEFPASEADRTALLRFRLRKSVPFHIDEAQLSYSVQLEEPKRIEVLAVAVAHPILHEYEQLFTDVGYRVGLVAPSSIAALPLCRDSGKGLTLLAKAAGTILTVFLLQQGRVRLVRCLDLAAAAEEGEESTERESVLPILQQTLAYAEDQIGEPVGQLLLCGFGSETDVVGRNVETEFGIPYAPVRSKFGAASRENAGLLGLLEQYEA